MIGRIIKHNEEKGYGFIKSATNQSFFFHVSNVKFDIIKIGIIVSFEPRIDRKTTKTSAVNIQNLSTEYLTKKYNLTEPLNTHFILKSIANNWKLDAKFEDNKDYFFYNREIKQIVEHNKYYVIGRKGIGKTSISEHLLSLNGPKIFSEKLNFKNFPFNELYEFYNDKFPPPNQYNTIWKYIIYSSVAKLMVTNESIDSELRTLLSKIYKPEPIKSLERTVNNWTSAKGGFTILGTGVTFGITKETKNKNDSWLQRVNDLEDIINQYCDDSTYYIIFDELDEDYRNMNIDEIGQYKNLLTSLYKAVQNVIICTNKKIKIKPIVFLRDDIYNLINDSDKTKWQDILVQIEWDKEKLKKLIAHRISVDANLKFDLNFDEVWGLLFNDESVQTTNRYVDAFDYISKSTHLRPRDYIKYLQVCAEETLQENRGHIKGETIKYVDRAFSNYLKSEITDEIFPIIPDINIIFQIISNIRKQAFDYDEFKEHFDKYLASGEIKVNKNIDEVLRQLYNFSIIGNQHSSQNDVYFFKYMQTNMTFNSNEKIVIHRGLFKALQIF